MYGWLYLIKNGDLYKIGITKNFTTRMRQLKPDKVISRLYSNNYRQLEKYFHLKYKNARIPQSEYFRLKDFQVRELKKSISLMNNSYYLLFRILLESFFLLFFSSILLFFFFYLSINDIKTVILSTLDFSRYIAIVFSIFSLISNSGTQIGFLNKLKYIITILFIYLFYILLISVCLGYFLI